ncbi:hypothetical protein AV530_018135 [Patagioenas fasciata monilis]|uniref:Uncharacterized protein n=1 Tax=Patagioenas fasciata monilis TaxID=372326 RepID=A0A1V4KKY5_PATFA|nr:hypothetical protein AV530_018135 [Patagioenas fasciata monilis]
MLLALDFAGGRSSHTPGNHSPTEDHSDAERVVGAERLTGSSMARVQPFWLAGTRLWPPQPIPRSKDQDD